MEYELLFFTSVANEERIGEIKKELTEILTNLGGTLLGEFTDIGKRKLAYPIKRNTHAFFSFVRFEMDDESKQNIPEVAKRISLFDKVMRHIIVRADEIGKPVISRDIQIGEEMPKGKRPARIAAQSALGGDIPKAQPAAAPQEKTVETKPKAALSDLDEKLTEILEETPS